ncbi:MAG: 30S ribosomal protein S19e [Candidatus Lokiarchaeota archaeon]|nr:30S ribosomal protein S19e [Candidatus Lokiarchaeota archaeon]
MSSTSVSVFDVFPIDLIKAVAEKLKTIPGITPPEQSKFWKTASFKEKSPIDQENFWYVRCASLLRKLYVRNEIGVNKLRKEYGGRDKNHMHKKHKQPGSGAIIRRCLQQLQNVDLVKTTEKGRALSPAGVSLLDKTALEIYKENPISRFTELSE